MKKSIITLATVTALATAGVPIFAYAGSIKPELTVETSSGNEPADTSIATTTPSDSCTECDKRQNARLDGLDSKTDDHGARLGTLEDKSKNYGERIDVMEKDTVRQPALENEAAARNLESQEREKGDRQLNERTDEAFGVLANHEGRIVTLENSDKAQGDKIQWLDKSHMEDHVRLDAADGKISTLQNDTGNLTKLSQAIGNKVIQQDGQISTLERHQKADHDKVKFLDERHVDTANRIDGLDRKTDQTADDASYAKGKADYLDGEHVKTNAQVYDHEGRITTLENADKAQNQSINDNRTAINNVNTTVNNQGGQIAGNRQDINALQSDMKDKASTASVDKVNGRVDTVESRTTLNEGRTTVLEGKVADNAGRTSALETRAAKGEARATSLEGRADKTEQRTGALETQTSALATRTGQTESRVTVNEGRTTRLENGAAETNRQVNANTKGVAEAKRTGDEALKVGNTAYHNTVVNSNRLDGHDADIRNLNADLQTVDRNSKVRSQAVLDQANGYADSLNGATNHRIDQLDSKVNGLGAMTGAMVGLPQAIHVGHGNVAVGGGNYGNANAIAVGASYRFDDDATTLKGSYSTAGHNGRGIASIGIGYEF